MARSLRDLVEFLLEEISLCGAQGASPAHIVGLIDTYYASPVRITSNYINKRTAQRQESRVPKLDRPFKEKAWTWLTRDPEVSVGKDREGNGLSLSEALGPDYVWPEQANPTEATKRGGSITSRPVAYPAGIVIPEAESTPKPVEQPKSEPKHHVFVSEERMWFAIADHGPDSSRLLPMEFTLLSIIASQKGNGITQPELVKVSGQDKRSVPKRTDALSEKGYIEKKPIQFKSARTSLCTLRKFVGTPSYLDGSFQTPAERGKAKAHEEGDVVDFAVFLENIFKWLKEYKVISRNDLKEKLGMADGWRWRILSRALSKLERIGCVKRIRAQSQYKLKMYHPSVMLIREPTERDLQLFHENSNSLVAFSEVDKTTAQELEDGIETNRKARSRTSPLGGKMRAPKKENVQESGRIIPRWTPGRSLPNMIFDLVDNTGPKGMPNMDIKTVCFGSFYRRSLETFLNRIVDCWQYSQPPHLRHLAIIRDTALRGTITHYVHYSYNNFKYLVENNEASWEAVEHVPKGPKNKIRPVPPVDAVAEYDENGFPVKKKPLNLLRGGDATLRECLEVAQPGSYIITSTDPAAVELANGSYGVKHSYNKVPASIRRRAKMIKLMSAKGIPVNASELRVVGSTMNEDVEVSSDDPARGERTSRSNSAADPFEGMSRKDFLIAQGYDETWTEFCVCVQERTHPGVYITPRGKRRAVVGRQGRPRISRIAVFKSEKLKELPWFTEPQEPKKIDVGPAAKRKATFDECVFGFPTRKIVNKRRKVTPTTTDMPGIEPTPDSVTAAAPTEEQLPANGETPTASGDSEAQGVNKRKLPYEDQGVVDSIEAAEEPPPKRKRGRPPKGSTPVPKPAKSVKKPKAPKPPKAAPKQRKKSEKGASANGENVVTPTPATPAQNASVDRDESSRRSLPMETDVRISNGHPEPAPIQDMTATAADSAAGAVDSKPGDAPNPLGVPESTALSLGPKPGLPHTPPPPIREAMEGAEVNNARSATLPSKDSETRGRTPTQEQTPSRPGTEEQGVGETPTTPSGSRLSRYSAGRLGLRMQKTGGGSIAYLRKKIVMEIMEKSGGIFPLGPELWYPFTTAWFKTKQTEKPDLRTVKSTVKTLVDAGRLRQLGFSGKDHKGVMVTKAIITLPEIEPTDERIQKVQKAMLSGSRFTPDGVEVDPGLRKSRSIVPPVKKTKGNWPEIDPNVTVNLHQKPAIIRALENRKDFSIQRRLLQGARVASEALQRARYEKAGRPPSRYRLAMELSSMIPESRPPRRVANAFQDTYNYGAKKSKKGDSGKRWRPISAISPYSLFMCPTQSFNPATGAFLTEGFPPEDDSEDAELLPLGLGEVFENPGLLGVRGDRYLDERTRGVFSKIESVAAWEYGIDAINVQTKDWKFVNHTVPGVFESVPLEGHIHYNYDLPQTHRPPAEPKFLRSFKSLPPIPPRPYRYGGIHRPAEPTNRPSIPEDVQTLAHTPAFEYQLGPKRRRRAPRRSVPKGRRLSKFAEGQDDAKIEAGVLGEQNRPVLTRRNRFARDLPPAVIQKIITGVVVVRSLTGGMEGKKIDWSILTTLFPDYKPKYIQERGRTIMSNNRLQISKMQSDFQEIFADAYERGEVPPIDYRNVMAYDWEWLVDWAKTKLEAPPTRKLPSLPATRQQFDSLFEIRKDPPQSLTDMYRYNAPVTLPRKRALLAGVPFALPLSESDEPPRKRQRSERLDTAKTWVRANVMAPEETYNPPAARNTLDRLFGEGLLDSAVKSLSSERVISAGTKGFIAPGRNYDVTEHFLDTIGRKRALEAKQLKRASYFKVNVLDVDMRTKGKHDLKYEAEDGDILVIINLVAEGRIELRPRNPPRKRYGLTDGGYATRLMDKNKLRFGIDVLPVPDKYVYGNPTRETVASVPAPRADMDRTFASLEAPKFPTGIMAAPPPPSASPGKIPMWFDIHGNFVRIVWDLAIAAVMGTIANRPGMTTKGIAESLNPSMGEWDVQLALGWLVEAGLAEKTRESSETEEGKADGPGWLVKEWWWFGISEREGTAATSEA